MKKKNTILSLSIAITILVLIFTFFPSSLFADTLTSGSDLNLYLGNGVPSDSYVKFGEFEGNDLLWRVLRKDDGTNGVLLISDKIITIRSFTVWPNDWHTSELRAWLNGDFYNGLGSDNIYIEQTEITTDDYYGEIYTTNDNIFIPDHAVLTASPFDSSIFSTNTKRIAMYGSSAHDYWTREEFFTASVYYVNTVGQCNGARTTGDTETGVRPMLYLEKDLWFSGTGTESDPYIITSLPSEITILPSEEEPVWVRTMPMTCWQVFINEDNMFEFIFWYPYKNNNWVRIYDMEDNLVAEIEVLLDDPHIVVDLPDGMYTVRTYWHSQDPIQEFIIGKP